MLMQTSSVGKTIPKAKLEFFRADGQGDRIKYYEVELENVLIASVNQAGMAAMRRSKVNI
jgi:type VI secretion system secreted protein Hcp